MDNGGAMRLRMMGVARTALPGASVRDVLEHSRRRAPRMFENARELLEQSECPQLWFNLAWSAGTYEGPMPPPLPYFKCSNRETRVT